MHRSLHQLKLCNTLFLKNMFISHGNFVPTVKIFSIPPYKWYEKAIHMDRIFKKSFNFERKTDTGRKLSL